MRTEKDYLTEKGKVGIILVLYSRSPVGWVVEPDEDNPNSTVKTKWRIWTFHLNAKTKRERDRDWSFGWIAIVNPLLQSFCKQEQPFTEITQFSSHMNLNLNSGHCVYFPSGSRRTSYLSSFLHWHILKKAFNSPRTCSGDSQHGVIFLLFVQILEKQLLGTAFCNQFLSHHIKWSFSKKALKASSQDHLIRGAKFCQIRSFFEHCSKSLCPPPPSFWTSCCKFFWWIS